MLRKKIGGHFLKKFKKNIHDNFYATEEAQWGEIQNQQRKILESSAHSMEVV